MLKFFANQGMNTAVLLRACLLAVVFSNLCNGRQNLNIPDTSDPTPKPHGLPSTGHFRIWSLISKEGDSLMTLEGQGIQCSGLYDQKTSLINLLDSTVFPQVSVTLELSSDMPGKKSFFCSVMKVEGGTYVVTTKPASNSINDAERFIPWRHGSYSMYESKEYRDKFLGCNKDGTMDLHSVHDKRHPDPRVLFLTHLVPQSSS